MNLNIERTNIGLTKENSTKIANVLSEILAKHVFVIIENKKISLEHERS